MKELGLVTNDQLIDQIAATAVEYRDRFNKNLGVTAEIGEYKAAKLLKLTRTEGNINEGFDARDKNNKRVQIKTRILTKKSQRTGIFSNHVFDYALLVLLSNTYKVIEIRKTSSKKILAALTNQSYKKPSLSISKFIQISKRVYP